MSIKLFQHQQVYLINHKTSFTFLVFIFFSCCCIAQDYLADTLSIDFPGSESFRKIEMNIDTVIDNRDKNPHLIDIKETDKYLVIPVDQYIWTKKPLNVAVDSMMNYTETGKYPKYQLKINEFDLKTRGGNIFPAYMLYTNLGVYQVYEQDTVYLGQLGYETEYPRKMFRDKIKEGYEGAIEQWKSELSYSLWGLGDKPSQTLPHQYNFSQKPYSEKTEFLYGKSRFSYTNNGFIIDGELLFSHRETKQYFKRAPNCIRYRNDDQFEALELGRGADIINYRLNNNWLAQGRFNMFLGFNKWKNPEQEDHSFWDLFLLDYGLSQGIHYDKMNQRNITFGIGVTEGIYYNYFSGVKFDIGGYISIGFKL